MTTTRIQKMPSSQFQQPDPNLARPAWKAHATQNLFQGITEDVLLEYVLRVLRRHLSFATGDRRMPANLIPVAREITHMLMHGGIQRLGAQSQPENGSLKHLDDTLRLIATLRR
jgi:hypothetical protein